MELRVPEAVAAGNSTVVGWGYNPAGQHEAFLVELASPTVVQIPTASNAAFATFAALLLAAALAVLRR